MRTTPRLRAAGGAPAEVLTVLGNFAEVWLAKEGHDGVVGVNCLEKIQLATAPAMFGAILAGVDHVLVGAGVPGQIPALADRLARCEPCVTRIAESGIARALREELLDRAHAGTLTVRHAGAAVPVQRPAGHDRPGTAAAGRAGGTTAGDDRQGPVVPAEALPGRVPLHGGGRGAVAGARSALTTVGPGLPGGGGPPVVGGP
ncbi:hypothetical protein [Streptomyces roseus]|uniref:hypothetical protein n=1 Tax=Streptomyces roseus TaxID=66430 RepID=UPI0037A42FB1